MVTLIDLALHPINIKPINENKLKKLLSQLKQFKVQPLSFLQYKTRNYCKIFQSSAKLIANDSDIEETFESMHQGL